MGTYTEIPSYDIQFLGIDSPVLQPFQPPAVLLLLQQDLERKLYSPWLSLIYHQLIYLLERLQSLHRQVDCLALLVRLSII